VRRGHEEEGAERCDDPGAALLLRLPADPRELEAVWLASYRGRLRIIGPRLEQFLRGPS